MVNTVGTFATSYARYGYEATFGTSPGDAALTTYFGHNVKFTSTAKNNIERIANLNNRNYTQMAAKKFEGTWSSDAQASNFYWMKGVLGDVTDAGAGPYTHTYNETNCPPSITIQQSEDLATPSERTMVGCLINKASLNLTVGEVVTVKMDGTYASESKDAVLNTNGNGADAEDVFTFAHGVLELPTSTTLTEVQSVDISIMNNADLLWGLGSRFATERVFKQRVYEIKLGQTREADTNTLNKFYGSTTTLSNPNKPADVASLFLTMSNGLGGTALRQFDIKLVNLQVDEYSAPLIPGEVVKEGTTLYALALDPTTKAVYTNNTAVSP